MDNPVAIGRIRRTHGIQGDCLVEPFGEMIYRSELPLKAELVDRLGKRYKTEIVSIRNGPKNLPILHFAGLDVREDALVWRGAAIEVEEPDLPPLEKNEFWEYELMGAELYDNSGALCGMVSEIFPGSEYNILEISKEGTEIALVPFKKKIIGSIERQGEKLRLTMAKAVKLEDFLD